MICKTCGETMLGDGYKTTLHCPSVEVWDVEPDADPIHCAPCPYCDGTGDVHTPGRVGEPMDCRVFRY